MPSLFVVSGPSGAGKSTLLTRVLDEMPNVRFSVSHTTRRPRRNERDGVHYHFVERPVFESLVKDDQFLEWAEVHAHLYGTAKSEYEGAAKEGLDLLLDVDVQGAQQVRARVKDAITVFILPPSHAALERRLRGRGPEDEGALQRRLAAADREMSHYREYDYVIVNENLDQSVLVMSFLIRAARQRTSRLDGLAQRILKTFVPEP